MSENRGTSRLVARVLGVVIALVGVCAMLLALDAVGSPTPRWGLILLWLAGGAVVWFVGACLIYLGADEREEKEVNVSSSSGGLESRVDSRSRMTEPEAPGASARTEEQLQARPMQWVTEMVKREDIEGGDTYIDCKPSCYTDEGAERHARHWDLGARGHPDNSRTPPPQGWVYRVTIDSILGRKAGETERLRQAEGLRKQALSPQEREREKRDYERILSDLFRENERLTEAALAPKDEYP